jgi:hypothetical protein
MTVQIRCEQVFELDANTQTPNPNGFSNTVVAINMANRMNADPLMVMQNLYVVYGKPSFSSQFLISTFNTLREFSRIKFEYNNETGDKYGCRAYATELSTGDKLFGSWVTMALAKAEGWYAKSGSKWQTMPDQMMMYRAASFFIRVYAPEISMGMQTREEILDTYDYEKSKWERLNPEEEKPKVTIFDFDKKEEIPEIKATNVEVLPKTDIETGEILPEEKKEKSTAEEILDLFGSDN